MEILVIDGQGGGLGRQIVENLRKTFKDVEIMAVGTNVIATQAMMKAGADHAATGENAVVVACKTADIIIGPIGIAIADSIYGEISPRIALAVTRSSAKRVLLPMNQCGNYIAGVKQVSTSALIDECMQHIGEIMNKKCD